MNFKNFLANLPVNSGVYSMYDLNDQVIYIGKAKNLKNRIKSYFYANSYKNYNSKLNALVTEIKNIEITVTKNEIEALLLENKLINQFKPKYNVIFRDDKSYPYILITNEDYPSIRYFRGKLSKKHGSLYGPYPNSKAVKASLDFLYKIFKLRSCDPVTFKNRARPCLEYQLQRCSAPCVGYIDKDDYSKDLENVRLFLQSKSKLLIKNLKLSMQKASIIMEYELAAKIRDQINSLLLLQNEQAVLNKRSIDVDVIGIASSPKLICIHLLKVRQGDILYSKQFFSKNTILSINSDNEEFLEEFILQNYLNLSNNNDNCLVNQPEIQIAEILTAIELKNAIDISKLIKIKLFNAKSGDKLSWQQMAQNSANEALTSRVIEYRRQKNNFKSLTELIGRVNPIERIVCFDVSHTTGKETIAACVVMNIFGKEKSSYRLFNIKTDVPGDDYQALKIAINRYMEQVMQNISLVPSLLIVDGGKGQLSVLEQVIEGFKSELQKRHFNISLLAIAKGKDRIPGLEKFYLNSNGEELNLSINNQVFKLLQQIRDLAHKFAISSHRRKRDKLII